MTSPDGGNEYIPFDEVMQLEQIDEVTFRSIAQPFLPGRKLPQAIHRVYGAHVYSQAVWAASQTIAEGLVLYNVTGNFLLPGLADVPFVYNVQKLRDGRSYSTRTVNATQTAKDGICFTCTCAFKAAEPSPLELQDKHNLWDRYKDVLAEKHPCDFPEVPGIDVPWYLEWMQKGGTNDKFPGLEMRQVNMAAFNDSRHPLDRRQLMFYRPIVKIPMNANLHCCAHLFASDRNGLYILGNLLDIEDVWRQMGSLTHTVLFHGPVEDLLFGPSKSIRSSLDESEGAGRWFCLEDWTDRAGSGRLILHRRVWNSEGAHVMTILQDGMTRVTKKPDATREEIELVRGRMSGWKSRQKL